MKIVIAADSFKENLSSLQVGEALEKGIRRVLPKARISIVPMADGGEGTVQSLVDASGGRILRKKVTGPLGDKVSARYGMMGDGETAVIEMAEASGLPLVDKHQRDPLRTTSFGTGELIVDALKRGASQIIVGLGGSATNDGGAGMAQALGARFLDARGKVITEPGAGGMLEKIDSIDASGLDPRLKHTRVTVACDVDNPLCGRNGASAVFGPQKGATPAVVKQLDKALKHFGTRIRRDMKKEVIKLPGAGAAGGLGAGLVAFAGAKLKSGVDIVIEATDLEHYVSKADLVITGEGRIDFQTAFGKTPAGVAKLAKRYRIPVIAIGGGVADDAIGVFEHGIHAIESTITRDMTVEEAMANSRNYVANAAERAMRTLLVGVQIHKRKVRKPHRKRTAE